MKVPEDAVKGGLLLALRDIDERIRGLTDKISEATDAITKRADVMRRRRFQELRRILHSAEMSDVIRSTTEEEPSASISEMEPDMINDVLIAKPTSVDGQVRSDALVARSNRLSGRKRVTVGCDCCGLGSVWIALLALFAGTTGPLLELTFVSDSSQAVRRYVREQYFPRHIYTDVRERDNSDIGTPRVEIYAAGFPCQPFSTAGSKKGFEDKRSNVFFACVDYIREKRPDIFLLENVPGLLTHNQGASFERVLSELHSIGGDARDDGSWRASYDIDHFVLNTSDFGPPQNRRRLFILGRRRGAVSSPLSDIVPIRSSKTLS